MTHTIHRTRRALTVSIVSICFIVFGVYSQLVPSNTPAPPPEKTATPNPSVLSANDTPNSGFASIALETLPVKGRAAKTGYERSLFGNGWQSVQGCDMRNRILARDLKPSTLVENNLCLIASGTLQDPYTGKTIQFARGNGTSSAVQIDHVVALSDAWQKGAQQLSSEQRHALANDPLELLAVDGPINMQKSDGDAATWLPPNKLFRCHYVARQIAVKQKYSLWVTDAEKSAIKKILTSCPNETLPKP